MPGLKWTKKYLDLPLRQKRFINNFFSTRDGRDEIDYPNWANDCMAYGYTNLRTLYWDIKKRFAECGPLPEVPEEKPRSWKDLEELTDFILDKR